MEYYIIDGEAARMVQLISSDNTLKDIHLFHGSVKKETTQSDAIKKGLIKAKGEIVA